MRSDEDTPAPHLPPAADPSLAAAFRSRGYEIERELGRGGMATVYLAHDVKHDRRVALKVLSPELSTPQFTDRFAAEIRVTANLSHPNILPLFDSGNADGRLYYAMPYLEGDSLRARLERETQLPVDEAVALIRVLAGALEYAHKRGVIHRDIKPENILFQDGQPLVADFGIALALSSVGAERLTSMGVSVGTPQYMSPEQAAGEQTVGPPSDIYSLAAVAYELLAGEPPFAGPNTQAVLARVMLEPPRPIRTVRSTVPPQVEAVILQALAKQPVDRFATAAAFSAALQDAGTGAWSHKPRWSRGRKAAGFVFAVSVIAVAIAGVQRWEPVATMAQRLGVRAAAEPQWVLVADFGAPPDDPQLGLVVRELVSSALDQQSRNLSTIPREQLADARRAALIPDSAPLFVDDARHLALRTRVRTVVDGRIQRIGTGYSVFLRALNVGDGKTLASVQGPANDTSLFSTVEELSRQLASALGKRDASPIPQIPAVASTHSLDAYRHFVAARAHIYSESGSGWRAAAREARQAIALDPEFAAAWNLLAFAYSQIRKRDSMLLAYREALRHSSRLTTSERLHVEAMIALRTGRPDSAVRLFDAALDEDPSNADTWHDRGMALRVLDRFEDAAASFQRSVELMPLASRPVYLNSLATTLATNGQTDSARRVARSLTGGERTDADLFIAIGAAEWDEVRRIAQSIASDPASGAALGARFLIASTQAVRGQVAAARAAITEMDETQVELLLGMATAIQPANRRVPVPSDADMPHTFFRGVWHLWSGDSAAAAREIKAIRANHSPSEQTLGDIKFLEGWAAPGMAGQRNLLDGLAHFQTLHSVVLSRWLAGDTYERLGRVDSAIVYFELLVRPKRIHFNQSRALGFAHSFALRRLALLYDRMGQRAQARRHWQQFLDTFTDPDPELLPLVEEARKALARRN